jgi:hypothetical protein
VLTSSVVLFHLTQIAYPFQVRYGARLRQHWTALVHRDPASLHACICVAASNTALFLGEFPMRENQTPSALLLDTFHHRGETIRLVNEGLSDPVKASSDSLIAAVSTLLTIEVWYPIVAEDTPVLFADRIDCFWKPRLFEDTSSWIEADDCSER